MPASSRINWTYSLKRGGDTGSGGGAGLQYSNGYTFTASSTNPTSVITWHIQKPDSTRETASYGPTRGYRPKVSGYYTIVMKSDNAGLLSPGEVREMKRTIYLFASSCTSVVQAILNTFGFN